jgi:hypothetical protein
LSFLDGRGERDTVMHTHIHIPTGGSDLSKEPIQYGTALAMC